MWPFRARGLRNSSGPGEGGTRNWQARADPAAPCCQPGTAPLPPRLPARARRGAGHRAGLNKVAGRVGEHPAVGAALQPEPEVPRLLRFIDGGQRVRLGRTVRASGVCWAQGGALVRPIEGRRLRCCDSESECAGGAAGVVRWQLSVRWERPLDTPGEPTWHTEVHSPERRSPWNPEVPRETARTLRLSLPPLAYRKGQICIWVPTTVLVASASTSAAWAGW